MNTISVLLFPDDQSAKRSLTLSGRGVIEHLKGALRLYYNYATAKQNTSAIKVSNVLHKSTVIQKIILDWDFFPL